MDVSLNTVASLQFQIDRLGVSVAVLGESKGVEIVDSPESANAYELASNDQGTIDLDVIATLAALELLPDDAGLDQFWDVVVDDDSNMPESHLN